MASRQIHLPESLICVKAPGLLGSDQHCVGFYCFVGFGKDQHPCLRLKSDTSVDTITPPKMVAEDGVEPP